MDSYLLGKDIQQILSRLERLEEAVQKKKPCGCHENEDKDLITEAGKLTFKGKKLLIVDGAAKDLESAEWTWDPVRFCGDGNYCNWRSKEILTYWENGHYEDKVEISCEHGILYNCWFTTEMNYKSNGAVIGTTKWNTVLSGTNSTNIDSSGHSAEIQGAFYSINAVSRARKCSC